MTKYFNNARTVNVLNIPACDDEMMNQRIQELRKISQSGYWAACYARMGMKVMPVYHPDDPAEKSREKRGKRPIGSLVPGGVKDATDDIEQIIRWWTQKTDANIGIAPGPSGLIGIDIDGEQGRQSLLALENEFGQLPPTWAATTGRENGGVHLYFKSPDFAVSNRAGWRAGLDFRHQGGYLVAPPSVHQSGACYGWQHSPSKTALAELPERWLNALPKAGGTHPVEVKQNQQTAITGKVRSKDVITSDIQSATIGNVSDAVTLPPATPMQIEQCHAYVRKCKAAVNNNGGHNQTFAVARTIFYDFGLTEEEGRQIFDEYNQRCEPPWLDSDLYHKMIDAQKPSKRPMGWRRNKGNEPEFLEGDYHPVCGKYVFDPSRPQPIAEVFVERFFINDGRLILRYYAGDFYLWTGNCYEKIDRDELLGHIQRFLTDEAIVFKVAKVKKARPDRYKHFPAGEKNCGQVLDAVRRLVRLPKDTVVNSWIGDGDIPYDPTHLIFCKEWIYNWKDDIFIECSPGWFNLFCLPIDYTPDTPKAERFEQFLNEIFGDDNESRQLLVEYAGMILTGITHFHKFLMLVGPVRSGKGTLGRLFSALLGKEHVACPSTSTFVSNFGMQTLIGKPLAIVTDARFNDANSNSTVEKILCITGEDSLTIDRKYRDPVVVRLGTRLMVFTNEVPHLRDDHGAIATRVLAIRLTRSFLGKEDYELEKQLIQELPGILTYFIDGLRSLMARGRFIQPESGNEIIREMMIGSNPIRAFVDEMCTLGKGLRCDAYELQDQYRKWCADNNERVQSYQQFGKALKTAYPEIQKREGTRQPNGRKNYFYEGIALNVLPPTLPTGRYGGRQCEWEQELAKNMVARPLPTMPHSTIPRQTVVSNNQNTRGQTHAPFVGKDSTGGHGVDGYGVGTHGAGNYNASEYVDTSVCPF